MVEPRLVHQALSFLAALHGDDPQRIQETHSRLQRWREKSTAHEQAWQDAEMRWNLIHRLTPQLRSAVTPEPLNLGRRRLLRQGGTALAVLAGASWLGWLWRRVPQFDQLLETAHAEPARSVALPDGSQLLVAAQSNLHVQFSNGRREVMLAHGNVYFDVAHEALRCFVVHTRLGDVQVLGTAFSVSDRGVGVQVAVARGRVRVRGLAGGELILLAGDRLELSEQGSPGEVFRHPQAGPDEAHWRKGWWSFTDVPLDQVIAEVNAYSARPLSLGPGVARLRLTGSFPSDRPQMLLQALPKVLPVAIQQQRVLLR